MLLNMYWIKCLINPKGNKWRRPTGISLKKERHELKLIYSHDTVWSYPITLYRVASIHVKLNVFYI